jgi:hypothetical protein
MGLPECYEVFMLEEVQDHCPYCGEPISLVLDLSGGDQTYVEDCEVCCRPIAVSVAVLGDDFSYQLQHENET